MSHDHPCDWELLARAVLARFFKVWILIAAFFFAAVCVDFSLLAFAVLSICLQAGYLSGLFLGLIPGPWRRHKNPVNHGTRPATQLCGTRNFFKLTVSPSSRVKADAKPRLLAAVNLKPF